MGDDVAAILLTLVTENSELREQLASAQDMLMETAIDAGHLHARIEALQAERRALEKALKTALDGYDFVVVDTPPSLGLLTIHALVASRGVIVPVQCEYLSLRGLVQLENTLSMIRENLNPDVAIQGILATMFDGRTRHGRGMDRPGVGRGTGPSTPAAVSGCGPRDPHSEPARGPAPPAGRAAARAPPLAPR